MDMHDSTVTGVDTVTTLNKQTEPRTVSMTIKPVLVPDQDAATLRKLMDRFAEASTGPTRQELTESRAAVAAAPGVTEAAKWRTHPDAHDHDTDGSPMPKGGIKSDPLATRQGASRTQSEKDPKSLAGKFGDKYAKKHGVPTKQLMKNIPLDDIDEQGVAEGSIPGIGSNLPRSDIETFGLQKGRPYKINPPQDFKPGDRKRAVQQLIPTQDKKDHIRSRLGKHTAPVLPEQGVTEAGLKGLSKELDQYGNPVNLAQVSRAARAARAAHEQAVRQANIRLRSLVKDVAQEKFNARTIFSQSRPGGRVTVTFALDSTPNYTVDAELNRAVGEEMAQQGYEYRLTDGGWLSVKVPTPAVSEDSTLAELDTSTLQSYLDKGRQDVAKRDAEIEKIGSDRAYFRSRPAKQKRTDAMNTLRDKQNLRKDGLSMAHHKLHKRSEKGLWTDPNLPRDAKTGVTEAQTVGNIKFDNGVITQGGKKIGTAMQGLQHGYHPSIELTLNNGFSKWYELDTENLMQTMVNDINDSLSSNTAVKKPGARPGIRPNIKRESQGVAEGLDPETYRSIARAIEGYKAQNGGDAPAGEDLFDLADDYNTDVDTVLDIISGKIKFNSIAEGLNEAAYMDDVELTASQFHAAISRIMKGLVNEYQSEVQASTSTPSAPDTSKFRATVGGMIEYATRLAVHGGYYGGSKQYIDFIKIGAGIPRQVTKDLMRDFAAHMEEQFDITVTPGVSIATEDGYVFSFQVEEGGTNWGGFGFTARKVDAEGVTEAGRKQPRQTDYDKKRQTQQQQDMAEGLDQARVSPETLRVVQQLRKQLSRRTSLQAKKTMLVIKSDQLGPQDRKLIQDTLTQAGITFKIKDNEVQSVRGGSWKNTLVGIPYDQKGVAEGAGMSNHSKIMGLIRTYYDSMGRDFWPWFNEPGNKEFFARRINVSPEEAYEVVDSMDWGQVPHEDDDEDMKEGWKQKVAGAALAGAAALGAGGAQAQTTDKFDPSWRTSGYDTHIRSDVSSTKSMNKADPSKDVDDFQKRIQTVTGPNAKGEYKVLVMQGNDIVSLYVTKTPPPGWLYKEDAESVTEAGRRQPGRPKFTLYPSYHAWRLELMRRGDDQIDHLDNDYVDNYRVLFAVDRNRRVVGMYYRTADTGTFVPPGKGFSDMIYYADTDPHWPYSDDDGKEDLREIDRADMDEGWKSKLAAAGLAGAAALGGYAAGSSTPGTGFSNTKGIDQFNKPAVSQTAQVQPLRTRADLDAYNKTRPPGTSKLVNLPKDFEEGALEESVDPVAQLRADILRFSR
jgi:hypothetical protein